MSERSERLAGMSPEKLQRLIDSLRSKAPAPAAAPAILPRRPGLDRLPLSFSQERLWFLDRLDPGSPTFNLPAAVELRGALGSAALAAALTEVVRRHESLRTTFAEVDGVPVQRIAPPGETPLPRIDLAALPEEARSREAGRLASEHAAWRFDLARGPLLAAALLRLEDGRHHLLLAMHHIVSDGWSMGVLIREVAALYGAFAEGKPSPLLEIAIQYPDFALWQRETAATERERDLVWWSERLSGQTAPLDLPVDRPRPAVQTWRGGWVSRTLPADFSDRLRSFGQAEGASLFMTMLAGVQALLHRLAGRDDVVVGSPIAGRRMAETEPLIGFFLNLLAIRTDVSGDPGFRELVARVREVTLGAYAHQDLPFEALLAHLQPERDLSRTPLFQILFNLLNFPLTEQRLPGLEIEAISLPDLPSKFDLTFYVRDDPGQGIAVRMAYNADLFDAVRMEELLDQLTLLLAAGVENPELGVDRISLAATPRARSVLPDPAAELSAAWEGAVHEVFARQARHTPGALAAADPAESWTYGELDERSDRLAAFLYAGGIRPGDVVAFWAHRSAPLVWGVLGALKAGAAFLMLDPRYPAPRQAQMLGIARPAAWLRVAAAGPVPTEIESELDTIGCACRLTLPARADDPGFLADVPSKPPGVEVGPDDVAYVAFTSGSTGVPKGVLGRHGSLSHFIPWLCRRFELSAGDRFSMLSGLAHDPLHRDLFTPLQTGAAVVIPDPETMDEPGRLAAWMRREAVTVAHLTPALGQVLTTEAPNGPRIEVPSLRYAFLVGDVLTRRDVARLRRLAPGVTCVNYYGSTETQRAVGYHVAEEDGSKEIFPLGRGIPDVQILVLNPAGAFAGIGEVGEISMRSPHIALGYLGDPQLTSERFVADLYRTGDLGRYLPNGEAVFVGRADTQVKIRGFRIELGEIESVLGGFPGVREAVVIARQDRGAESYMAAYVVPAPGVALAARELRAFLRERLPDSMVPATFTLLGELPLTPNRKVDRKALPAPDRGEGEATFVAPETDLEREIATVWQEVLGLDRVGAHDNFFEVGGHSLLLVRLHARLQAALKVDLSLMDLFSHPNVHAQAEHIRSRETGARRSAFPARRSPAPASGRIAIVGMAGRFPGARDLEGFWRNLREGVESVSFFSEEELLRSGVPTELLRNPSYVPARAVVEDEDLFDAAFFEIPPRQAELMDPQLRFFLETSWHALESAGIDPGRFPGAIGIYGGVTASSYLLSNLLAHPGLLQEIGAGQLLLGTDRDFLTTQVSYKLGLRGPSIDVQTACSTSLVATHLACQALLTGDCVVALAGGVSIKVPQRAGYVYQESGPDSSDGHCRAFDARADGSIYGAGVGVVVLKRLEDALADGDVIHAVILGTAVNNDGSQKVGYTAPSIEGQAAVVATALDRAGVEPATIGYVECHGSGTALGDPIEVTALTRAFEATEEKGFCAIGSVKTNIGHLGAAAGVTGLIKAVLALEHGEIPPSLNFETPNPKIDFAGSPFRVNDRLSPWPTGRSCDIRPRRAGVNSLGQGGTNAHVVLEEAPDRETSGPSRPWQLLVLSARTETALEAATANLAAWMERNPETSLADAAFTLQVGRRAFPHRRAVVCRDVDEARRILEERDPRRLLTGIQDGGRRPVAFLLAGVGDHYPGMASRLYETEPVFRAALDRCFEILAEAPWRDLRETVFADGGRAAEGGLDLRRMLGRGEADEASQRLHRTLYAQPAVFAVEHALAQLWISWGVEPEALLGYSLGEYVAACLAGVFPLEDALPLVAERARWIEELPAGSMLAVPLPEEEVRGRLSPGLDVAAVNGPQLSVVSGLPEEVASLASRLEEEGIAARQLPTTHAFHSRRMEPLAERLTERVRRLRPMAPRIPVLSNVTGTWLTAAEATDPAYWARHLCGQVRFSDGLAELWKNPSRVLLEVGPGQGLSALALQHPAAGRGRIALPSLPHAHERKDDASFLLSTLGRLWLAGAAIDWTGFWREERRHRLELPFYPFERRRFWVEAPRSERGLEAALFSSALEEEPAPAPPGLSLHERPSLPYPWVAPRNQTEAWIAGQIERLLGIAGVGVHDSFFELGGHSLLGTQLLSRLRDGLGIELPISALFESPTPAELAARIETARGDATEAMSPIERLPRTGPPTDLPLSFAQERLWFLDQLQPGSAAYNIPTALHLEGSLNVAALASALTGVARRHETLRTTFPTIDGAPVQRISPPGPFPLAVVDLAGLPEEVREGEGAHLTTEEPRTPFDLASGPLTRASLVRLGERDHLLLATQHHIVSDGWSLGLFVREVASLYRAFASGEAPALSELLVQYADFAGWQRRWLSGTVLEGQVAWWRERLTPQPPVLGLPLDRPRPAVETFRGGRQPVAVPADLTVALAALGRERGATLFMTLLAGFTALLGRLTSEEDLAVGSPIAGRTRSEVENLIGLFINTLVLRTDQSGDPTFLEALTRVREMALGAYAHQELPFERLVEELRPERSLGHSPLFQVLFILQNVPAEEAVAAGLTLRPLEVYHGVSRFDLTLSATEIGGGLLGYLEYKTDLLDAATAARWLGHFGTLLSAAAAEPGRRLSALPVLSGAELSQILDDWNDTATEVPAACVPHLIAERAARSPEDVAVVCEGDRLTRAQLEDRAARLAGRLRALGVGPESLVGIALERSLDLLVATLGVWKAGGAYLPLDPGYPAERIGFMLADSGVRVLLTYERLVATLPAHDASVLCLDREPDIEAEPLHDGVDDPDHLAYVLYTSGSTGRPKGVQVTHGALANFLASMLREPGLAESDVLLAVTSLSFDIAGLELYLPLLAGARLEIASAELAADGARLAARMRESGVTVLQATPATWRMLLEAGWEEPGSLRLALCGGEALLGDLAVSLLRRAGALWNLYGPTETTIWSAAYRVEGDAAGTVPIGRPVANTQIYLLDSHLGPVPPGVPGEVWIGGAGVARGYLGRPDLTAERFGPDPFSAARGARLYRTGDLARIRPGGPLEFLGRADHQIKIRGHRIELGEIEAALGLHPSVAQIAVAARDDWGDRRLVAYVVPAAGQDLRTADLRAFVRERLPEFMEPSAFVTLDALPLTPNRKVDRRALPAPEAAAAAGAFVAPRNPVEEVLASIWAEVLRVERVGVVDDFFALGGHSLLVSRVVSRVHRTLGVAPPLRSLFEAPTVASLAVRIEAMLREGRRASAPPLRRLPLQSDLLLSFAQERLWFLDRLEPGSPAYNLPLAVQLTGSLDPCAMTAALAEVVRRHEALRTTFALRAGRPVQVVGPPRPMDLPLVDLAALPEPVRKDEAKALADAEAGRPFDLATGPLLRGLLLRLDGREHRLVLVLHHIVADGWSLGVLVQETAALYEVARRGRPSPLPELPVQYADYAAWQRSWLTGEVLDGLLDHWRARLAGAPALLELPTDRPRPQVQRFHGARLRVELSGELVTGLRDAGLRERATPFMTLLAGFTSLLARHGAGVDLPVGAPVAGRNRIETEGLIGLLLNTVVLRSDLSGDPAFGDLLARLREVTLDAYTHQDLPFERLVEALVPRRDLSHSPLFQVMLVLQDTRLAQPLGGGSDLVLTPLDLEETAAKLDLILNVTETSAGLTGSWRYNRDLFDLPTAARMLRHLQTLLAGAAANPRLRVSELPVLTAAESAQLAEWNLTEAGWPLDLCLHERIEAQVERTPGAAAVSFEGEEITYRELNVRANRLAWRLRELGVGPDVPVGICVERSLEMVVGLLAILKAGGAYVPLDPSYPAERLAYMLEDSAVPVLLTREDLAGRLPAGSARVVALGGEVEGREENPLGGAGPGNLAYIIYTSGSTGRPKGAMNTHRGISNRLLWMQEAFGLGEDDRVLQKTPVSFDVSVWELFWPLMAGARLVVARPGAHGDPAYLVETIAGEGITTIHFVPSMLQVFVAAPGVESCRSLRRVIASGEALPGELQERLARRLPVPLFNLYGPTEAAVDVTWWACRPDGGRSVPIGRPIANTRVHLLDRALRPVPAGVPGEIFLGGVNLARGYLRRPDLTAERFVPEPTGEPGERLYRTGDLGRYRPDGAIEFLVRLDHQVKIRGFRVELGEIEAVLAFHPAVREAVVLAREDREDRSVRDLRLAAYVVAREGQVPTLEELRGALAVSLPDYMLPTALVVLDAMPLNPSGKVDRAALARIEPEPGEPPQAAERRDAPRTPVERFLDGLFREALRLPAERGIGIHDSFFTLGGNSIDAAVLVNRLQEDLEEIVHVVVLFEAPSIALLASYLVREHPEAVSRLWRAPSAATAPAAAGRRIEAAAVEELRALIPAPSPLPRLAARNRSAVFVLSPPRSGSTLLRVLLGGHPRLFAPPELELLPYGTLAERRAAFPGPDAFRLEGLPRALMELRGCGPEKAQAALADMEARGTTTAELYRLLQNELGSRILVDKTPSYTFHADILRRAERMFDGARYIHLIRHPHGMINSFEEARLDQIFLRGIHSFSRRELAELLWVIGHQNIMDLLREVPAERQLWIRFEDLVREPERALREISTFLGIEYHPEMAQPYKDRASRMTDGLHAESRMQGDVKFHRHAGIDPGVADRWREKITEDFLGEVTRETAVALGYPLIPLRPHRPAGEPEGWERIPRLHREPSTPLPLSFSQERLWFLDRLDPGTAAYNVPAALRLTGALDVPALAGSLREIARRHEALRTRFALVDGRPAQIVEPEPRVELPVADLSALPEAAREAEALRLAAAESAMPFDLERGPLLRAALLRLGTHEHAALLTMHHIVADGWSMGILIREVGALYPALVRGEASPLPEPDIQYADFAAWQRRWLSGERLAGLIAGWKERLADAPATLELPTDRPRPAAQTFRGGKVSFHLGEEAAAAVREPARGEGLTSFMVLLAAFQALLFRHSGQEDLVVGTPTAGRNRREAEGLIGVFINSLPLRADLSGDPTWSDLLRRTRERTLEAYARQDLPFEKLVEELQPPRDLARPPVFQVMLAQQNMRSEGVELPGLRIAPLGATVIDAKLELTLSLHEESLSGQLEYNADLFERATVERMLGHFSTLLAGADPDRRLSDLPLLTTAEREQLAVWSRTAEEVPAACVHELFAAQAARTPDAGAVVCGDARLTYRELEERANRLAHHLRRLGVRAESLVGLSLERSADLVVGLLGILKAGGAYLPLDPSYPAERLAMVLEDSGAEVLVTARPLAEELFADLPVQPERLVLLDAEAEQIARLRPAPPAADAAPGNLAYVLFTSGSTGRPKGVAVTHCALVSFLASMRRAPGLKAGDRLLAVTSLSFDIAGLEIWLPLVTGGCIELATREEAADGPALAARLAACGARVMQATPSTWRMLLDTGWTGDPRLAALCGGEALPRGLAAALRQRTGELWNLYGPTETTIWSSVLEVGAEEARGDGAVAIGRPIANTSLHVLDGCGQPAAVGIPGELLIGGLGVTRGYLGRPDLTAERFVPDLFSEPGARLYRTGDLARRRPDGALEFLGRLDHQVKVRGFRIELGEIEAALARHPTVAQAVVVVSGSDAGARLSAHLVPRGPVDMAELRSFLARSLPAYMAPGAFVEHSALPLTPNGKIDRKALARLAAPATPAAAALAASPLEEAVAILWAEVLGAGRVGPRDDFFALGGHSIMATLLMHRVRQSFGVDLPLRTLFAAPTVAGLAAAIAVRRAEAGEEAVLPAEMPRIVPDVEGLYLPFPLTDVQEAYWIGRSGALELGSVATHVYFELDATGLDLRRFERAVQRLVEGHGMLRAIVQPDGRQRILPEVPPYRIVTVDLRGADAAAVGEALLAVRGHLSHQVLPSDRWPLFELAAALLPAARLRLYVSIDMLIGDAWSLRLLGRDLGLLYEDPGAALPPLEISFRDYVLAEAALRDGALYDRDLEYWRGRLADIPPPPQLPLAKSPSDVQVPRFVRRDGRLPAGPWTRLKERAARAGLTPSVALLAAWSEVLAAWTGTSRFTLNLTLFNRLPLHPQVNQLVGDFTSLTLLAVERRPEEPFVDQARRLQQRLWDDLDHRLVSGVRVLREVSRLRREPRTMMPVVFTSTLNQAAPETGPADGEEMKSEGGWGITQTPQVWLDHQVAESRGALTWKWDAVEELFPAGLLDDMFASYVLLLERLAEDEETWREPVRGLLPAAQLRLLEEVNATAVPIPAGLLHEPFVERARRTPEAPAVITSSRTLTYGELDRISLALAGRLRRLGVQPNRLVAVVMHKGWEQVAVVLAVLRAGAAYLPVDAKLPAERLRHLLVRGEVAVALTQPGLERSLSWPEGVERVVVDGVDGGETENVSDLPALLQTPEDLAYVIFTSGSTGEPKGVMIDHRGALNTVVDVNRRFDLGPGDRVLALSSLSFDLSVWDLFGLLAAGGTVVIPDSGAERDPEHWAALAARERVTVWNTVPALMEMLVEHAAGRPGVLAAPLRLVLLSGDWIPVRLPDRIRTAFPDARVVGLGGATEASIWSILYPIGEVGEGWASIPYGRPMDNQRFHVLDEDLDPCPVWVPGHLYIGGIGLALGYWRDEEKTAAAFLVHPRTGERLYRTGDLGRLLPSGDIEFLGRDDTQVKVQGHRIELGEIEAVLACHPAVGAAVVSAVGEARGAKQLVAYVVLAGTPASAEPARPAVISDPVERLRFKLAHHNLRPDDGRPAVALRQPELSPEQVEAFYVRRRSYRRFLREALSLDDLAGFLACLAPVRMEGLPFPKHRYGSAGSLYPVQTYLHVKEGRVEGLAGGIYYYDPERHRLALLAAEGGLDASLWDPVNRSVFEESAFAVFLIARLAAIAPLYGERAHHFAALEAGLMTQLLEMSAPNYGIGLAQMGGLRFEAVRPRFALDETCELMHTLLGGRIAPDQAGLAALQADMAEQHAMVRLLEQQPDRAELPAAAQTPEAAVFAELREHLRALLPEYMLPPHFVRIEHVPLSANGKVDRKALPAPAALQSEARSAAIPYAPPETEVEQVVARVVGEVLGVPRVGLHENFFDLGANSVQVVRVHNALRETLGVEIPIVEMFNHPNVRLLARRLSQSAAGPEPAETVPAGPGADREERLREGKDWRRQRLQKRQSAGGL